LKEFMEQYAGMSRCMEIKIVLKDTFSLLDFFNERVEKSTAMEFDINLDILQIHLDFTESIFPKKLDFKAFWKAFEEYDEDMGLLSVSDFLSRETLAEKRKFVKSLYDYVSLFSTILNDAHDDFSEKASEAFLELQEQLPFRFINKVKDAVAKIHVNDILLTIYSKMKALLLEAKTRTADERTILIDLSYIYYITNLLKRVFPTAKPVVTTEAEYCINCTLADSWPDKTFTFVPIDTIFGMDVFKNLLIRPVVEKLIKKPSDFNCENVSFSSKTKEFKQVIDHEIKTFRQNRTAYERELTKIISDFEKKKRAEDNKRNNQNNTIPPRETKTYPLSELLSHYEEAAPRLRGIAKKHKCLKDTIERHLKTTVYFLGKGNLEEAKKALDYLEKEVDHSLMILGKILTAFNEVPKLNKGQLRAGMDSEKLDQLVKTLNKTIKTKNGDRRKGKGKQIPLITIPNR